MRPIAIRGGPGVWEPRATQRRVVGSVRGGTVIRQNAEQIVPIGVRRARLIVQSLASVIAVLLTIWSAVIVKEATVAVPLAETGRVESRARATADRPAATVETAERLPPMVEEARMQAPEPGTVRWFDGRRARPVRTIWMRVTAYSPDARSCGIFADGQTATLHSVWTNGMRLVAADTRILPYGSLVSVPGYADDEIVPVLDCGGAIKGNRLDVLFPTHEIARKWGVRDIPVTVWAYDDED